MPWSQGIKYLVKDIFVKVIPSIVDKMIRVIRSKLEVVKYLSFTTDVWSLNVSSDSLLSLTAHWVNDDFQLISAVLQAQSLEEQHTGEYMAMKITKIMEDWGISTDQIHCVVRDNGSNIVKAMSEAGLLSFICLHTRYNWLSTMGSYLNILLLIY